MRVLPPEEKVNINKSNDNIELFDGSKKELMISIIHYPLMQGLNTFQMELVVL